MKRPTLTLILAAAAAVAGRSSEANPFVPTGVQPGGSYHIAFVTSGTRDATSTSIADYDAFVNAQAANNPALTGTDVGITYYAVASTPTTDAAVTALVTAPVYNLNDELVATGFADMWDGTLQNPILYDESAVPSAWELWTGTETTGLGGVGRELGTPTPRAGDSSQAGSSWIYWAAITPPNTIPFALYGLSEELVAPAGVVPEPSSLAVLALGALGISLARRRP